MGNRQSLTRLFPPIALRILAVIYSGGLISVVPGGWVMADSSMRQMRKRAFAYALYPWIADPGVKLVWFSRGVYLSCVAIAAFEHGKCQLIAQIIGIQTFFSLIGMNGKSRRSLKSPILRTSTSTILGLYCSAVLTLALFCFKEIAILVDAVTGRTVQYDDVFYPSVVIFVVLATTWVLVERLSTAAD